MSVLSGKRLLVLGGANQHEKFVEAAERLGVECYVADYLETSQAKRRADHAVLLDINDLDGLETLCRREHIDGVVAAWLDPCQLPYVKLCERLGLPCYGSSEQFNVLTNKASFKKLCSQHGVNTIESYSVQNLDDIVYPVFVKPAESRGSRGQHKVYSQSDLGPAIVDAMDQSLDNRVIIERLMDRGGDISVTYFFVDGEACLERLSDRFLGDDADDLGNVAVGTYSPSVYSSLYMDKVNSGVVAMLKAMGIKNGPVFMQGFVDGDTVRFYDPGFRFPGGEYERAVKRAYGIDFAELLIEFALTGSISRWKDRLCRDMYSLDGKVEVIHDISLKSGTIAAIEGVNRIEAIPDIVSLSQRYFVGDDVPVETNVSRRFLEINLLCESLDMARSLVSIINSTIHVYDEAGTDMVVSALKPEIIGRKNVHGSR